MKLKVIVLILVSQFLFYNCTEETNITEYKPDEVEVIVKKLTEVIEEYHPNMARIYFYDEQNNRWVSKGGCNGYRLEPPFIIVCNDYYHLQNLVRFGINDGIELFFNY